MVDGAWRLKGSTLTSTVTTKSEWLDGEEVTIPSSEHHIERIHAAGPDAYESRWEDGTIVKWRRCTMEDE